jgi:hypothetical protein
VKLPKNKAIHNSAGTAFLHRRHCVKAKQKAATRLSVTADCEYGCLLGCAALLIVDDHLRCRFAHFKLVAHLLDLRCLLFEA